MMNGLSSPAILLLLFALAAVARSDNWRLAEENQLNLVNWIRAKQEEWPSKEDEDGEKAKFYLYYNQDEGRFLNFRDGVLDTNTAVSDLKLSFKYWVQNGVEVDLQRKGDETSKITLKTETGHSWETLSGPSLNSITSDKWKEYGFVTTSSNSVLALKDIQASYLTKSDSSDGTSFANEKYWKKINSEVVNILDSIEFNATDAPIIVQYVDDIEKWTNKTLTFDKECNPNPNPNPISIKCAVKHPKITLEAENIIPVLSIKTGKDGNQTEHIDLLTTKYDHITGATFTQSKRFESKDWNRVKFTLVTKSSRTPQVQVSVAFENATMGSILPMPKTTKEIGEIFFYPSDYFALDVKTDFSVTLKVSGAHLVSFTSETDKNHMGNKKILTPHEWKNSQWIYQHPSIDYTIKCKDSVAEFKACDAVANCFPFEFHQENGQFLLTRSSRQLLGNSPYVRIVSDTNDSFTFGYSNLLDTMINTLKKHIQIEENDQVNKDNGIIQSNSIVITTLMKSELKVTIPLSLLDLRWMDGIVTFTTNDTTNKVVINSITLGKQKQYREIDLGEWSGAQASFNLRDIVNVRPFEWQTLYDDQVDASYDSSLRLTLTTNKEVKITIQLDLKECDNINNLVTEVKHASDMTIFMKSPEVATETKIPSIVNKATYLISTPWIQGMRSNYPSKSLGSVEFKFTKTQNETKWNNDIRVARYILNNGLVYGPDANLQRELNDTEKRLTFTDSSIPYESPLEGPVKILYRVQVPEGAEASMTISPNLTVDNNDASIPQNSGPNYLNYNPSYDSNILCPNYFKFTTGEYSKPQCQLSTVLSEKNEKCEEQSGCLNLFTKSLMVGNFPKDLETSSPYYYPVNSSELGYLEVKRPHDYDDDFCILFSYVATKAELKVGADRVNSDVQNLNTFGMSSDASDVRTEEICTMDLDPMDYPNIKKLVFWFESKGQFVTYLENHRLHELKVSQKHSENFYLINYYSKSNDEVALVELQGQGDDVTLNLNKYLFRIEQNDKILKQLFPKKDELTYEEQKYTLDISRTNFNTPREYLSPVWIQSPNQTAELGLQIKGKLFDKEVISARLYFYTYTNGNKVHKMTESFDLRENTGKKQIYKVDGDLFRISILFTVDQVKLNEYKKNGENDLTITLENISINDPCVNDGNIVKSCSDHGKCYSKPDVNDYECRGCKEWFTGKDCETTDYCKLVPMNELSGNDYCKQIGEGRCQAKDELGDYECQCKDTNTTRWVGGQIRNCIATNLTCSDEEYLTIEVNINGKPNKICKLRKDFLKIDDKYVKINPCNKQHRQSLGWGAIQCPNTATCNPTGFDCNSYTCKCNANYYQVPTDNQQTATCLSKCDIDAYLSCEQACTVTNQTTGDTKCACKSDKYKLDNDKCTLKDPNDQTAYDNKCKADKETPPAGSPSPFLHTDGTCQCIIGFKFDMEKKYCKIDNNYYSNSLKCGSKGVEMINSQVVCKCGQYETLNTTTRHCEPLVKCNTETQIIHLSSINDTQSAQCVDKCSLVEDDQVNKYIEKKPLFADCKPNRITLDSTIQTQMKLPLDVYVFNKSKAIINGKDYKCQEGFEWTTSKCLPKKEVKFNIELDLVSSSNIEINFKTLIEEISSDENGNDNLELQDLKCDATSGSCSSLWVKKIRQNTLNETVLRNRLNAQCVPVLAGQTTGQCVYFIPDQSGLKSNSIGLLRDISKQPNVSKFDYCQSNRCSALPFTECHETENQFECTCNERQFKPINSLWGKNQPKMEECTPKTCAELGWKCDDSEAECSAGAVKQNDNYIVQQFCHCPKTNKTLADTHRFCKDTCDGNCKHGIGHKNGNKCMCTCDNGWTGEKCDKKNNGHDDDNKDGDKSDSGTSNGFKVATIILAVVAAVLIIGLIILCVRRPKRQPSVRILRLSRTEDNMYN